MTLSKECQELLERWPLAKVFDLPADSTVIVVGAYQGLAMELLSELYKPLHLVGFEPQNWAVDEIIKRMKGRSYTIFPAGLGITKGHFPMGEWHTDACSFVNTGPGSREQGEGDLWDANDTLLILNPSKIDLMMINIEGGEWELIPYLRKTGWMPIIDRIAVQWHLFPGISDELLMRHQIDWLIKDGLELIQDERPAWTYHKRNS